MKVILGIMILGIISGVGWRLQQFHDANYISKNEHRSALKTTEKKINDDADWKINIAQEAAAKAATQPVDTPADVARLCEAATSCRDRR